MPPDEPPAPTRRFSAVGRIVVIAAAAAFALALVHGVFRILTLAATAYALAAPVLRRRQPRG